MCAPIQTVSISTFAASVNVIDPVSVKVHLSAVLGINVNDPLVPAVVATVDPNSKLAYKIRA